MRLELGGGRYPKGDGFVNVDGSEHCDIRHDLDVVPWPFESNSVSEVYSSHCLEHLDDPIATLREIARVCRVGAAVVIRVPDSMSELMFVRGHKSCVSEGFMLNTLVHFESDNFPVDGKRLRIIAVNKRPCPIWFPRAKDSGLFKGWTDQQIMTWIPKTCHENEFVLKVEEWK